MIAKCSHAFDDINELFHSLVSKRNQSRGVDLSTQGGPRPQVDIYRSKYRFPLPPLVFRQPGELNLNVKVGLYDRLFHDVPLLET